jgi:ATP-dependent protease ClpP protease subunit
MTQTWAFKATEVDGKLDLHIYDPIGASWFSDGVTAKDVLAKVGAAKKLTGIHMRIYSLGGILDDGKAIHNLMREKSAEGVKVTAQVDALAASAATFPLISADDITVAKNAMVMIHEGSAGTPGRGTGEDHAKIADRIERENAQMAEMYADASKRRGKNVSAKEFRAKMKAETYLTAQEAIDLGLADHIGGESDTEAVAACASALGRLEAAPARLTQLVASLRGTPPTSAPRAEPQGNEMTYPRLLAVLGLTESATEASVMAAYEAKVTAQQPFVDLGRRVIAITGKDGDAAIGTVTAWKEQAEKVPALELAQIETKAAADKGALTALIDKARAGKKLTKDGADKLQARVEAGFKARDEMRSSGKMRELTDDEWTLGQAKAYVEALTPNAVLAGGGDVKPPKLQPSDGSQGDGPLLLNGKAYEEYSPDELVRIRSQGDALAEQSYQDARADWISRGKPRKAPAAKSA